MSFSQVSSLRFEVGAVLVGTVMAAIGAIIVEPIVLILGASVAAVFTTLRILDRAKVNADVKTKDDTRRRVAV